eukprot:616068-Pleurochrysis_carterae.AAC.2
MNYAVYSEIRLPSSAWARTRRLLSGDPLLRTSALRVVVQTRILACSDSVSSNSPKSLPRRLIA